MIINPFYYGGAMCGKNLYNEQCLAKYHIKTGSIQTALKTLIQKDIVNKNKDRYYFQDPSFEYYIRGNF